MVPGSISNNALQFDLVRYNVVWHIRVGGVRAGGGIHYYYYYYYYYYY